MRTRRLCAIAAGAMHDKSPLRPKSMPRAWRSSGENKANSGFRCSSIQSCISLWRRSGRALLKSMLPVKRITGASFMRASISARLSQAPPPLDGMQNSSSSSLGL